MRGGLVSLCSKTEARVYFPICHHYYHDNSKFLPEEEQKLIDFSTGRRDRDDRPVYGPLIENIIASMLCTQREEKGCGVERKVGTSPRRIMLDSMGVLGLAHPPTYLSGLSVVVARGGESVGNKEETGGGENEADGEGERTNE